MSDCEVAQHYQSGLPDLDALLARIDALGETLSAADLASLDQFHMGGLGATAELARRAAIVATDRVIDVGSGLGGPARWLAETFGCDVVGLDLTPSFVAVAERLSHRLGLGSRTRFLVGDALAMPFESAGFDVAVSQHVSMNISDRAGLLAELRRVLVDGGRLALFDPVLAFAGAEVAYPTPWAL